ncbi:MAG: PP2C family protein-serine/threonine phosphatase [Desulfobacterales bacterium]|nr:PP2C family protein-serine/threonine phosphatase [Desulfobacterales bacterium]
MKKPIEEKHLKAKLSLIPVLISVGTVSALLFTGIALLIINVLINISSMATDTRDNTLPVLYSSQRIIISLERLGRFGEIINTTLDKSKRRKAQLAALTLGNDPDFENNPILYAKVWKMLRILRIISKNKKAQDTSRKMITKKLLKFDDFLQKMLSDVRETAEKSSYEMHSLIDFTIEKLFVLRLELSEIITEPSLERLADSEKKTQSLLADIASKFEESPISIKTLGQDRLSAILETSSEIHDLCKSIIKKNDENAVLWKDGRSMLDILKNNISADTVTATADRFSLISEKANYVMKIGITGLFGMVLIILALIFFVHHYMTIPIVTATRSLEKIDHQHLDIVLPPTQFKELDAIYRAVEQLQKVIGELANANEEIRLLNQKLKAENIRLNAELDVARQLQQMILPKKDELRHLEGIDLVGSMTPADEVGGDYYDIIEHGDRIKIGIGDVTGHGLESGVMMLMAQTAVQTLLLNNVNDPRTFLDILNKVIFKNAQRIRSDKTMSLAMIDYKEGELKISGQHESLILVRKNGEIELLDTIDLGFPIGLVEDIHSYINETKVSLQSGDGIVLYSDGITEAENDRGEFYELDRLCNIISSNWDKPAEKIKNAVFKDITQFINKQKIYDDLTLVILKLN